MSSKMELLRDDTFPLSSKYDLEWMFNNRMGSHCLWLLEGLTWDMELKPGMRVLDMGCGNALTSIFLAKEFGVKVFANDLWVKPTENWNRVCEHGLTDLIYPIYAEAHSLPYADGFFDAIIAVNSYQFYGTSDIYFNEYFGKLVKSGGQIALAIPGLINEIEEFPQDWLDTDQLYYHSLSWWKTYFKKCKTNIQLMDDYRGEGNKIIRKWQAAVQNKEYETVQNENMSWYRVILKGL